MQTTETTMTANGRAVGARSKAPVFVLGCPRSGTTLLYHMLLSAGNFVVYRTESQVFNLLEPRFGDLSIARNKRKLLQTWEDSALFTKTGLEASAVKAEVMARCQNAGDFLRIVMDAMARKQGVERWAETTPITWLSLRRIKETIPNALVIHIIRDGRDVALSLERQHWIRPFPWDRDKRVSAAKRSPGSGWSTEAASTERHWAATIEKFTMRNWWETHDSYWRAWENSLARNWITIASSAWASVLSVARILPSAEMDQKISSRWRAGSRR